MLTYLPGNHTPSYTRSAVFLSRRSTRWIEIEFDSVWSSQTEARLSYNKGVKRRYSPPSVYFSTIFPIPVFLFSSIRFCTWFSGLVWFLFARSIRAVDRSRGMARFKWNRVTGKGAGSSRSRVNWSCIVSRLISFLLSTSIPLDFTSFRSTPEGWLLVPFAKKRLGSPRSVVRINHRRMMTRRIIASSCPTLSLVINQRL